MPKLTPPYVALWDSEVPGPESDLIIDVTSEGPRISYENLRPGERDKQGVLWGRMSKSPGLGKIDYSSMHPDRQYETMYALKCQVCRHPANRDADGWLFFDWRRPESPPTWPENSRTTMPPLCAAHADVARRQCPHLRGGEIAVLRVKLPRLWGVAGTLYRMTAEGWTTHPGDVELPYGDSRLAGMLASRLVRELRKVTVIEVLTGSASRES
ncbi:hypothetical protein ACWCYZ_01055 [Streptomyces virginiae]|uniref:hypothetical protein n=1 Tax=Streptomyces TaxID=1883 RepID=UPI000F3AA328|nr:hypothetical protein [Streptomyces sp. ADI95-16]AYV29610.1 hypothetical protein EES41_23120 [Streptomyces sp. ADI95-16]